MRRLGPHGPELSVLGVGTAPIGSGREWLYWGAQDEGEAVDAILAGLDAGANWIDTAPFYGWGRAEEIVRRALRRHRDDVFVYTNVGTVPAECALSRMDNRPEAIRADLEASLLRLGRDYVDLVHIHDVDPSVPIEDSWWALQELIEEGKALWAGLSNHTGQLVQRAHRLAPVTSVQEQLSLLAWPDDPGVLDVARAHGIGILAWAPLASGFLTDGFDVGALEEDDFRRRSRLAGRGEEIERHRADAAASGRTLRRHAVAWVLEQPGVTAAIVGVRNEGEGRELAGLASD